MIHLDEHRCALLTIQTQSGASPYSSNDTTINGRSVSMSISHKFKLSQPFGLLDANSANSQSDKLSAGPAV